METWKGASREAILRNGPRCQYCGLGDNGDPRIWQNFDLDHLIPRGHGHDDDPLNHVVACAGCNSAKSDFDPSGGGATRLTAETRPALIDRARERIRFANRSSSVPENYRPLLDAIRGGVYPQISPPGITQLGGAASVGMVSPDMVS